VEAQYGPSNRFSATSCSEATVKIFGLSSRQLLLDRRPADLRDVLTVTEIIKIPIGVPSTATNTDWPEAYRTHCTINMNS